MAAWLRKKTGGDGTESQEVLIFLRFSSVKV